MSLFLCPLQPSLPTQQYAPALRELRRLALVFVFHPPSDQRLLQRIRNVCTWEGLPVTVPSLSALCAGDLPLPLSYLLEM